jgi:hypothetical protein
MRPTVATNTSDRPQYPGNPAINTETETETEVVLVEARKKKMKMTKMPVVVVAVCFLALFSGALRGADASFAPDAVSADGALPNTLS